MSVATLAVMQAHMWHLRAITVYVQSAATATVSRENDHLTCGRPRLTGHLLSSAWSRCIYAGHTTTCTAWHMGAPALGGRFAIRMATYYTILQCMFIFGCISCQYRLMVYHVNFTHVDITKMMPLKRVWDIFTQMSLGAANGGGGTGGGNRTTHTLDSEKQLDLLLARHKNSNDVPIHVYKGLFDADIVLSPKIQEFVTTSVASAFPWTLNVDSVDLITILYSLGVLCYGVLYHATTEKLRDNDNLSEDSMITPEHINKEFLLSDCFFWVVLFLLMLVLQEVASSVSMMLISVLCACNFTVLLFLACTAGHCPIEVVKSAALFVWAVHAVLMLVVTDASILDGSCLIFIDITLGIFYYINVVEKDMTVIKFLNVRLWTTVFLNFCFIMVYVNNVLSIDIADL
jgi:hypothetical protein